MKTLTAIACLMLAGCASTGYGPAQRATVTLDPNAPIWLRGNELDDYACPSGYVLSCRGTEGGPTAQQLCRCR